MTKRDKPAHAHRGRKWGEPGEHAVVIKYERRFAGGEWEPVSYPDMEMALKETGAKRVRAGEIVKSAHKTEYRRIGG